MLEGVNRKMDNSMLKIMASKSINAMIACLLNQEDKICKKCNDVDVCNFLTEAIFVYRHKLERTYLSTFDT